MIMGWVAILFPAFGVRLLAFSVLVDADAAPLEAEARGGGAVPEADRAVIVPVVRTHVAGEDGDQDAPEFLWTGSACGLAGNADGESVVRRRRSPERYPQATPNYRASVAVLPAWRPRSGPDCRPGFR